MLHKHAISCLFVFAFAASIREFLIQMSAYQYVLVGASASYTQYVYILTHEFTCKMV